MYRLTANLKALKTKLKEWSRNNLTLLTIRLKALSEVTATAMASIKEYFF